MGHPRLLARFQKHCDIGNHVPVQPFLFQDPASAGCLSSPGILHLVIVRHAPERDEDGRDAVGRKIGNRVGACTAERQIRQGIEMRQLLVREWDLPIPFMRAPDRAFSLARDMDDVAEGEKSVQICGNRFVEY